MSSKFRAGDKVRIFTPSAPDSPFNGSVGVIREKATRSSYFVDVDGLGEHVAIDRNLELLPMVEQPRYLEGIERAKARRAERQARITSTYNAFLDTIVARDAEAAKAARERSEARLKRYPPTETMIRFLPVPRGSKPLTSEEIAKAFAPVDVVETTKEAEA